MDIRNGHAQTVEKVLRWVDEGARRCTPLLLLSLYAHSICGQYSLVMGISICCGPLRVCASSVYFSLALWRCCCRGRRRGHNYL